ncbi:hypothetical protein BC2230_30637 [Burkholderia cepacia]
MRCFSERRPHGWCWRRSESSAAFCSGVDRLGGLSQLFDGADKVSAKSYHKLQGYGIGALRSGFEVRDAN